MHKCIYVRNIRLKQATTLYSLVGWNSYWISKLQLWQQKFKEVKKNWKLNTIKKRVQTFWHFMTLGCLYKKVECANSEYVYNHRVKKWALFAGESRCSDSLQMFCVFSKKISQVGHRQHGGLRVLHGCAGVTRIREAFISPFSQLNSWVLNTLSTALTFSLPS